MSRSPTAYVFFGIELKNQIDNDTVESIEQSGIYEVIWSGCDGYEDFAIAIKDSMQSFDWNRFTEINEGIFNQDYTSLCNWETLLLNIVNEYKLTTTGEAGWKGGVHYF